MQETSYELKYGYLFVHLFFLDICLFLFHADFSTRKRNPLTRMYTISGQILQEVSSARYLGVNITNKLDWSKHVASTTKKSNGTLAFLRRNLKTCPKKIKENAYTSLVRPVLEYGAAIWDPHLGKDISSIEMVQRRAARFVTND